MLRPRRTGLPGLPGPRLQPPVCSDAEPAAFRLTCPHTDPLLIRVPLLLLRHQELLHTIRPGRPHTRAGVGTGAVAGARPGTTAAGPPAAAAGLLAKLCQAALRGDTEARTSTAADCALRTGGGGARLRGGFPRLTTGLRKRTRERAASVRPRCTV